MRRLVCTVVGAVLILSGCTPQRAFQAPPPPGFAAKELPFSDADAFDALLEGYLTNGTPAIRVLIESPTPDWPPRLVAWLKAYQAGGKVQPPSGKGGVAPLLWLATNAQTSTEARTAVEGLLDRGERLAATAVAWWCDERQRQTRIDLLRPYLLDAERDAARGGNYVLVLYNGRYGEPGDRR